MGCSACAAKAASIYTPQQYSTPPSMEDCSYTVGVLEVWKNKINCIKTNEYYSQHNTNEAIINSYLGFILSGIANPDYICKYKIQYDEISSLIILIVNKQLC